MRVWLSAFVVLFAIAELFEWLAGLGSWQPTGVWLILGGMGLAALSNAAHLPKLSAVEEGTESTEQVRQLQVRQLTANVPINQPANGSQKATGSNRPVAQASAQVLAQIPAAQVEEIKSEIKSQMVDNKSDSDSISFKVRPLKR